MRHWELHRTRSKVALLVLINLVALVGGKYTALLTLVKSEWWGDAMALAKAPKKKLPTPHLSGAQPQPSPAPSPTPTLATRHGQPRHPAALLHVIRRGETLAAIASSYGLSVDALRQANRLPPTSHLIVGETLRIPPPQGTPQIAEFHQTLPASHGAIGLGGQRQVARRTPGAVKTSHGFIWPVAGPLTSPFGERDQVMGGGGTQFHAGLDLSTPAGTPVQAAQAGVVVFAGDHGAYGKAVKLEHAHGFATLYAHHSQVLVYVGQSVKAGQVIGLSGSSGRSTGPHLHFEVHKDGWPVDPLPYLQ
jgi:murein DD-endopeptidase MepM/ murein hydrolase activator NlpD